MNVTELKQQLHIEIDNIEDQEQLEEVLTLLHGPKVDFKKMTNEEYVDAIRGAQEEIQRGAFTDVDDMEKESESW